MYRCMFCGCTDFTIRPYGDNDLFFGKIMYPEHLQNHFDGRCCVGCQFFLFIIYWHNSSWKTKDSISCFVNSMTFWPKDNGLIHFGQLHKEYVLNLEKYHQTNTTQRTELIQLIIYAILILIIYEMPLQIVLYDFVRFINASAVVTSNDSRDIGRHQWNLRFAPCGLP